MINFFFQFRSDSNANNIKKINHLIFNFRLVHYQKQMFSQKFIHSFIRKSQLQKHIFKQTQLTKSLQCKLNFSIAESPKSNSSQNQSQVITYVPIRPLKKYLTPLYVQKEYLNKGRVTKGVPFWPYLTPFYAMAINNYLTAWSFTNTTLASILFIAGLLFRMSPSTRREREIIKLECNQDMSKLYMTVNYSLLSDHLSTIYPKNYKGFQDWNIFTEEELKNTEFVPTEADKRTYTEDELALKKEEFDQQLFQKIVKERKLEMTIKRFQLDTAKTLFKLSNNPNDVIKDHQVLHPPIHIDTAQMFNVPFKYLIVRTEFMNMKKTKPYHFCIDLENNGDIKYQDYLVAIGANYKISLTSETK